MPKYDPVDEIRITRESTGIMTVTRITTTRRYMKPRQVKSLEDLLKILRKAFENDRKSLSNETVQQVENIANGRQKRLFLTYDSSVVNRPR